MREPCPHADQLPPGRWVCAECRRERQRLQKKRKRAAAPPRLCRYCGMTPLPPGRRTCDACKRELHRQQRLRWLAKPGNRERQNAWRAEWDRRHPDYRRRWQEERWKDPVKRAADLESQRFSARLKRERDGRPFSPVPEEDYPAASSQWVVDAEPVRAIVRRWGGPLTELARASGVSERLLGRLMNEDGNVTVAAADRITVTLGLHLDVIYQDLNGRPHGA